MLDSRPSSEFSYESGKAKLANLELNSDAPPDIVFTTPDDECSGGSEGNIGVMGRQGKLMRLAGWVDLDSRLTVSCATISSICKS